jgi:lipopolysaccharide export system permease protein
LERYRKLSYAITIFVFFLIGAPLGSIIKKGGLGLPVLISITFFILFYVITMMTEKLTRQDIVSPFMAAWMANILLFPVGLFFLRQAKNDARLLETDFYQSFIKKFLIWLRIKPKR